jgi:hypothetical protein
MFVEVGDIGQDRQEWKAVPSLVRLELPKDRYDRFGQIISYSPNLVFPALEISPHNGEVGVSTPVLTRRESSSSAGVIESVPEILNGIRSNVGELPEVSFGKYYLELFQTSVRIYLDNAGATVLLGESSSLPFKISDVLLCSS